MSALPTESDLAQSRQLGRLLLTIESRIALLNRCRPLNMVAERSRLLDELERERSPSPQWVYDQPPEFAPTLHLLARLQRHLPEQVPFSDLWVAKVEELHLEAELAESVGQPRFAALARRRYPNGADPHCDNANALAARWSLSLPPEKAETRIRTDNARDSRSLLRVLEAELERLNLNFRLSVSSSLQSNAATGQNVIVVASDRWLNPQSARRIALHEIHGHAIPRLRASNQVHGLLLAGAAGSNEQEEGRALLIEQHLGLLDQERRLELGLRHQLATLGSAGNSWIESVRHAHQVLGCWSQAVDMASRTHRGGGLFRESCYLVEFFRLQNALTTDPDLERWLSAGRTTIQCARRLRAAGLRVANAHHDPLIVGLSAFAPHGTISANLATLDQ